MKAMRFVYHFLQFYRFLQLRWIERLPPEQKAMGSNPVRNIVFPPFLKELADFFIFGFDQNKILPIECFYIVMSSWCKQSFFFCILWILSWNVFCCYFLIQLCFCKPYFYETHMPILCFKMCFLLGIKAAKKMVENILEIDVTKPIFFYCPFQNDVIQ